EHSVPSGSRAKVLKGLRLAMEASEASSRMTTVISWPKAFNNFRSIFVARTLISVSALSKITLPRAMKVRTFAKPRLSITRRNSSILINLFPPTLMPRKKATYRRVGRARTIDHSSVCESLVGSLCEIRLVLGVCLTIIHLDVDIAWRHLAVRERKPDQT